MTHTHTHKQLFYSSMDFVRDNPGEPVPEETFTHSHLLWSSIIPYLLHPSTTIHGILLVQSMCLTVFFHNLSPSFLWSTSWPGILHFILRTFLHPIIITLFVIKVPHTDRLPCAVQGTWHQYSADTGLDNHEITYLNLLKY